MSRDRGVTSNVTLGLVFDLGRLTLGAVDFRSSQSVHNEEVGAGGALVPLYSGVSTG